MCNYMGLDITVFRALMDFFSALEECNCWEYEEDEKFNFKCPTCNLEDTHQEVLKMARKALSGGL